MGETSIEILLVEDNKNDVELTLRAFNQHNLTNNVKVIMDGAEALEFIFAAGKYDARKIEDTPNIILLDLKLPKVNGLDILKKIKSDERTKKIPVVVLTSSKEEKDIKECYKLGVNSYIVKPVDFNAFVKSVADLGLYWLLLNQPPI